MSFDHMISNNEGLKIIKLIKRIFVNLGIKDGLQ